MTEGVLYITFIFMDTFNQLSFSGGGGYSTKFHTERLRPEVQPLTLLYTIFGRKATPLVYLLVTNGTPFVYLV